MSVGFDAPAPESRSKVLSFSPEPAAAATKRAGAGGRQFMLIASLLAICILGLVAALWWTLGTKSAVRYVTAPVTRGSVIQTVGATGTVNPVLTVLVGTYVSGVIQSLSCDYNTEVKAGQVCAKIDPRPFQAALAQNLAQLARDKAILGKDQKNLLRFQQLAAQNSIARQQAEDQAYVVQQDQATVKIDEALVENAMLNLGYTDIVSPVDGTVVSRNVTQGQTVAASFQTPTLFLIASDLKKMQVDTNVSESDIGGIKEGDECSFTVDAFPKRTFAGKVVQVRRSPQTVQNVVTYDVVIGVDNSDLTLNPGMTASARITVDQRSNVIRVPDQALRYLPKGQRAVQPQAPERTGSGASNQGQVWVLRDGKPVAVPVTLGLDDDTYTEIVSGALQPGVLVITGEQSSASGQGVAPRLRF
jgi:HlyD family secretion protein